VSNVSERCGVGVLSLRNPCSIDGDAHRRLDRRAVLPERRQQHRLSGSQRRRQPAVRRPAAAIIAPRGDVHVLPEDDAPLEHG
jgi:hypothetical protein